MNAYIRVTCPVPLGLEAFKDAIFSCQGSHHHSVVCLTTGP